MQDSAVRPIYLGVLCGRGGQARHGLVASLLNLLAVVRVRLCACLPSISAAMAPFCRGAAQHQKRSGEKKREKNEREREESGKKENWPDAAPFEFEIFKHKNHPMNTQGT